MQLTTNAKELKEAVGWVSKLSGSDKGEWNVPGLANCVILSAHHGNLAVQTTNFSAVATEVVPAEAQDTKGVLAVEAKMLKKYLAKVAKKGTVVKIDGDFWSTSKARVRIEPLATKSEDVPNFSKYAPSSSNGVHTDFDNLPIKDAMKFMANDEGRAVIASMLFEECANRGTRLVACDGFRLVATPMDDFPPLELGLIPGDAVKLMADIKGTGYVRFGEDRFEAAAGNRKIAGQQTEGKYANWREIIPKETSLTVTVETAAFRDALDTLAAMATDFPGVRMELADGEATLYSLSEDTQCEAVIRADWQGEPFDFAFMPKYMLDILPFCGDTTTIDLESPSRCMSIRGEQALCLLMPVHIKQ